MGRGQRSRRRGPLEQALPRTPALGSAHLLDTLNPLLHFHPLS
jgi:hypothetical protein